MTINEQTVLTRLDGSYDSLDNKMVGAVHEK